jgi:hypothetical protein
MKSLVKGLGKEFNQRFITKTNFVNIISPVNKKTTPNHNPQYREIDPMKPPNSQWMFVDNSFHCYLLQVVKFQ